MNFDSTFITPPNNGLSPLFRATGGVCAGDFDQDGWLDLFFSNGTGGQTSVSLSNYLFKNDSAGIFFLQGTQANTRIETSTSGRFVDFDGDGDLDIYVSNSGNTKSELYRNDGGNVFVSIDTLSISNQFLPSNHASWCDYDNDGDVDLFLPTSLGGNNKLYRNDDSTFTEIISGSIVQDGGFSYSGVWGDYNGDSFMDLFVCNSNSTANFLYKNLGNGNFLKITTGSIVSDIGKTVSAAWVDFDNDGDLDLVTASGNGQNTSVRRNRLYINNGNETFTRFNTGDFVMDQSNSTGIACGDIDRDGDIDLALSTRNGANEIYFNNYNGSNGFISLNILGTNNKSTALDAKVRVKCQVSGSNSKWQYQHVISSRSNSGESSPIIHFGTGTATIIDTLEITWITGATCIFTNLNVNQFYNISPSNCDLNLALETKHAVKIGRLSASFSDSTVGAVSRHIWRFGDGNTSKLQNPTHQYARPGTYTVEHLTFDSYQKWDSAWSIITVCPDTAQLGFSSTNVGQSFSFTDTSISNGYDFQWDFGDGMSASGTNVNHRYSQGGIYTACLYVTDSCRIDTICQTFTVCNDTLEANFGQTNTAYAVAFSDSSINANSILWDFGDGTQDSISTNPIHTYTTPGYYTVCMIVEDDCNTDTLCQTVGICLDTATAGFSFVDNVTTVNFTSSAQHASTHAWDFGDGNTSNSINPNHTYQQPGTYNVCLVVTNDCYTDTLCQTVSVCLNTTQASFSYSDTLTTVSFTSTSAHATSYLWDFGDGSFSTLQNPTYTYQQHGTYTICLTTTNDCGSDTTCKTINVCPKVAVADFTSQHKTGLHMQFYQQCTNAVAYHWDFDDGNFSTSANPSYAFNNAQIFNVCLTATDSCGKADVYCKKIDLTIGIDELALLELIKVYPNPANDYVYIELPKELTQNASVTISDVQGKVLATQPLENTATSKLDISQYASGIYIINLQLNGASKQVKVRKE